MKIQNKFILLAGAGFFYILSIFTTGCAQIGMPTGGLKDTLPPVLLNSVPANQTKNFTSNRIVLSFDEYVQLDNVQQNLIVSPVPKLNPNVDYRLRTVTIRLRDTLQENTTYKIELGNAIQDINENNPLKNYTYTFSTGNYIDSLTFGGNVQVAETGAPDTTLIVMLYKDLSDSAVFKSKPSYITKVNREGDFLFSNLPPDTFHVFALKDESGQRIYSNTNQVFAFADSAVQTSENTPSVNLFAYAEKSEEQAKTTNTKTKPADSLKVAVAVGNAQDILEPLIINFNHPLQSFDSTLLSLTDTLFKPFSFSLRFADTTMQKLALTTAWQENGDYRLILNKGFATDTSGRIFEMTDTIPFRTKKEGEYGSIKITFQNLEKYNNPVLQFVSNNQVAYSFPLPSTVFQQKLFIPGSYELRILEDANQNGNWDPGHYDPANIATQKQPERVHAIPQALNIKAGWDNERDIIL